MKQKEALNRDFEPTRRRLLRWLAGAAGALIAGPGVGAARGAARSAGRSGPAWKRLRDRVGDALVLRTSPGYERDRRAMVWSAVKPDRYPEAIVHAASEDEVREAIRFAAGNGLRVGVRGGGHHFNAPGLRQGCLLLDLSGLGEIRVDAASGTAAVGPAATASELAAALAPHGLAFPVGHCPSVPLSGYLLNGGFGWNGGAWGPACQSVTGLDVVDARGESLRVDAGSHPDLYWAARGAGVGFPGVVTRFHLRLHPLPKAIRTSTRMFPFDDFAAVGAWLATVRRALPAEVELLCVVTSPPPEMQAQGAPPRALVVSATVFAATPEEAANRLAPFADGPEGVKPFADLPLVDTPFAALLESTNDVLPPGRRCASEHVWSNAPLGDLLASVRDVVRSPPSPRDFLLMTLAPSRTPDAPPMPDMALSRLGAIYASVFAVWNEAERDAENRAWVRAMDAALGPHRVGRYVGETDLTAGPDRARECFSAAAWKRLAAVRKRVDPDDLFYSYSLTG